ncbi:MAG: hypothetical protein GXO57_09105 [Thermodesulfobacteria bacterium]|nr:hypothetical protein [Thermodesulfobacteriota bacterium]
MKGWEKIYLKQVEERLKHLLAKGQTPLNTIAMKKRLKTEDIHFLVEQLGEEGAVKFLMEEGFYYDYKRKEIKRKSRVKV